METTREFTRFREIMADRPGEHHLVTNHIALALLDKTDWRVCALASRLSHESWTRSTDEADAALLGRLIRSGDEHAKSLRWMQFCIAIEAPRYWWAEADTYTVGVTPMGSTSTMHKEARRMSGSELVAVKSALPEGTLQLRIRGFSWHTLRRIIDQRQRHRLPEWHAFCDFATLLLDDLKIPYHKDRA